MKGLDAGMWKAEKTDTVSQSELIERLGVKKPKCYFTTDISEELSCCSDGNFDSYGFPENICEQYPCEKFKKLCKDIRAAELAKASNA